jgi:predicted DNA-binding ribbon-helix-helix protein
VRRTQILLSESQWRRLRRLAAERGVSVAQVVREALDLALERGPLLRSIREARRKAAEVAGRFRSGLSDVAANHDAHLAEAYRSHGGLA